MATNTAGPALGARSLFVETMISPDQNQVPVHGIVKRNAVHDVLDERIEELQIVGYTVIESGFNDATLDGFRTRLAEVNEQQEECEGAGQANDAFIVRCPLASDDMFLSVATCPPLMEVCRRILGENFVLLQQNGVINRPNSRDYQSRWHRDLSYQHFVTSRKIALNALLCLDDFTLETGGTVVLPATHSQENFPSDSYVRAHETVAVARAGLFLVMDAMLFHRSGNNVSANSRSGINHLIGLPFFSQQLDIPRMLKRDMSGDPFLKRYLGYQWNPAEDVHSWRSKRS